MSETARFQILQERKPLTGKETFDREDVDRLLVREAGVHAQVSGK